MEVSFENYGEVMSPSNFVCAAQTRARVPYSSPILMIVHFESVRLEKISWTLENVDEIMSPTYLKSLHFFTKTSKHFSSSDSSLIGCSKKEVYGV